MVEVNAANAAEAAKAVKTGAHLQPAKSLAEALARIYADGGRYVQKTGQMTGGPARYSYAREGDFIAALRPLMELHGVTFRPVGMQVVTNEVFQRKNGGDAYRVVILVTFEFLHTSGEKATVQTVGEGQDSGDKAFNKAMTAAMKYALRQSFVVETGDDPDDTPSHEQERRPAGAASEPRADRVAAAIGAAKNRDELAQLWRQYERDRDAGRFSAGEATGLNAAFKAAGAKFPKPAPA